MSTQSKTSGSDGFWSSLKSGLNTGVERLAGDVLPIWAATQLVSQEEDTLSKPTFQPNLAPPRINNTGGATGPVKTVDPGSPPAEPGLFGLSNNMLLIVGGVLLLFAVGALALFRR